MSWLAERGAHIYCPVGHSPNIDVVAEIDGRMIRIEVKTSTHRNVAGRWKVLIATRGGNQSWNGLTKYFDPARCDYLFVHTGGGRRWLIPTAALDCRSGLTLGGSKYSEFEIEPGSPIQPRSAGSLESRSLQGEYRSGQTGGAVNAMSSTSQVRILPPPLPIAAADPVRPTNRDRRLGKQGQAIINQKRRMTIPQAAFFDAGFVNGSKVAVRCTGPGRIAVEQVSLPDWATPAPCRPEPAPEIDA